MQQKMAKISSPSYTLKSFKNFPLRNLELTFTIADFERRVRMYHVNKILHSMVINQFFDNVICVIQKRRNKFEIIDGQHRITALELLRDNYGIRTYDLVLMIFDEKLARTIYRRINLGSPLKLSDHLMALDNNQHKFFTKLRPHFVHYNDGRLPKFEMILNALSYAKNGSPRAVRPQLLDRMFNSITVNDIKIISKFSNAIKNVEPFIPKKRQNIYRYAIYRNIFRVGYENNFDEQLWEDFITTCKTDPEVEKSYNVRSSNSVMNMYVYMIKNIAPRLGLKLQKIERTNTETRLVLDKQVEHPASKLAI